MRKLLTLLILQKGIIYHVFVDYGKGHVVKTKLE